MGIDKDTLQERNTGQAVDGPGVTGRRMPSAFDCNRHFADGFTRSRHFGSGREWTDYEPAYQYGFDSYERYRGRDFDEVQGELAQGWNTTHRGSRLGWNEAKDAVREGWHYLERTRSGAADR